MNEDQVYEQQYNWVCTKKDDGGDKTAVKNLLNRIKNKNTGNYNEMSKSLTKVLNILQYNDRKELLPKLLKEIAKDGRSIVSRKLKSDDREEVVERYMDNMAKLEAQFIMPVIDKILKKESLLAYGELSDSSAAKLKKEIDQLSNELEKLKSVFKKVSDKSGNQITKALAKNGFFEEARRIHILNDLYKNRKKLTNKFGKKRSYGKKPNKVTIVIKSYDDMVDLLVGNFDIEKHAARDSYRETSIKHEIVYGGNTTYSEEEYSKASEQLSGVVEELSAERKEYYQMECDSGLNSMGSKCRKQKKKIEKLGKELTKKSKKAKKHLEKYGKYCRMEKRYMKKNGGDDDDHVCKSTNKAMDDIGKEAMGMDVEEETQSSNERALAQRQGTYTGSYGGGTSQQQYGMQQPYTMQQPYNQNPYGSTGMYQYGGQSSYGLPYSSYGTQQSYQPYGMQQPYQPYGMQQPYQPYGMQQPYQPYGTQQPYTMQQPYMMQQPQMPTYYR